MADTQSNLYNFGIYAFEEQNFETAYQNFYSGLQAHKILKENNRESTLDDPSALADLKYVAGLAALNGKMYDAALPLFEELFQNNYDKPAIYEALYTIKANDDNADFNEAYKYLEFGREKYPEDVSLLFAEINFFLKTKRLDQLIFKLETAIEKEPNNLTLYTTLGTVYDNLYQSELEAGNTAQANNHFDQAMKYYQQTLTKDPNVIDALYGIGALFYNKAAKLTVELQSLANDLSEEGKQSYNSKQAEVFATFEKALSYFQQVERLNPNDQNTLIALKEIYSRKGDIETSNMIKERLEKVQAGGRNTDSLFQN